MTMHTIFFKENEGIFPDPVNGPQPAQLPFWSVGGSQPPAEASAAAAAYDNQFLQLAVAKESDQVLAKKDTNHFTMFPGDCRSTGENAAQTTHHTAPMEYHESQFKLAVAKSQVCVQYPQYEGQCYGIYSAYGAQTEGQRMMLPLSMASDGGPIFVNAKQYNGIMRRRRLRAKAELKNQEIKTRKPYMHVSRHLHAVRRRRGSSGRFLSTKCSNTVSEKKEADKPEKYEKAQSTTRSQMSEVLQSDRGRSTTPGSEANSYLHHFEFDLLQPSFQPFMDVGISNKYLKV